MRARLAVQDAQEDRRREPGKALKVVDGGVPEEGHGKGHGDDDDDSDRQGEAAARDGAQQLAAHDARNGRVSNVDHDVEDRAELCAPEAQRVAGNCNLAQAGGRAQSRCEGGHGGAHDGGRDGQDDGHVD